MILHDPSISSFPSKKPTERHINCLLDRPKLPLSGWNQPRPFCRGKWLVPGRPSFMLPGCIAETSHLMRLSKTGKWWNLRTDLPIVGPWWYFMVTWWFGCHQFSFPIHIGNFCHHPNWRSPSFFRTGWPWPTNQSTGKLLHSYGLPTLALSVGWSSPKLERFHMNLIEGNSR